jgi:hypothetical protein
MIAGPIEAGLYSGAEKIQRARRALGGLASSLFRALLGESPEPPRAPQTVDEYTAEILQRAKNLEAISRSLGVAPINADHARMAEETNQKNRERGR